LTAIAASVLVLGLATTAADDDLAGELRELAGKVFPADGDTAKQLPKMPGPGDRHR